MCRNITADLEVVIGSFFNILNIWAASNENQQFTKHICIHVLLRVYMYMYVQHHFAIPILFMSETDFIAFFVSILPFLDNSFSSVRVQNLMCSFSDLVPG